MPVLAPSVACCTAVIYLHSHPQTVGNPAGHRVPAITMPSTTAVIPYILQYCSEVNRTTPVRDEIAPVRDQPARSAILLNRGITRAHAISDARHALQDLGYDVLATTVPRLEVYAQSFGMPVADAGCDLWRRVARELVSRCAPPCRVRS